MHPSFKPSEAKIQEQATENQQVQDRKQRRPHLCPRGKILLTLPLPMVPFNSFKGKKSSLTTIFSLIAVKMKKIHTLGCSRAANLRCSPWQPPLIAGPCRRSSPTLAARGTSWQPGVHKPFCMIATSIRKCRKKQRSYWISGAAEL
jgi:hypothetical protein